MGTAERSGARWEEYRPDGIRALRQQDAE